MDREAGTTVQRILTQYGALRDNLPVDPTDPASRRALRALWEDIFKTAAQQMAPHYHPAAEVESDPDRPILNIVTQDFSRRINISASPQGGVFAVFTKHEDDGYTPEYARHRLLRPSSYLPDRTELMIATDLDPDRLIAAFAMIRAYTHADIPTLEAGRALERQFIATYRHYFGFADFDPFAGPTSDEDDDRR